MDNKPARLVLLGVIAALLLCCLVACKKGGRSTKIICGENCGSYQHTDSLPEQPPQGTIRIAIGGDSRDDIREVVPWAFKEARRRGAKAFLFLGDLELHPAEDEFFLNKLKDLKTPPPIPFYPVMGNHEVLSFGFLRRSDAKSQDRVKEFKDRFIKVPVNLASFEDQVVYAADLDGNVHFIALDNVSRKGGGFGTEQLDWIERDLKTASAAKKVILVGMHKGLANNPVTTHAMDEDGAAAIEDSDHALRLFSTYNVALVVVSHNHMYAAYNQHPANQHDIEVRLTGGLGAPLVKGLRADEGGFHHFLLVDVPPGENKTPLRVEVVKFQGTPITADDEDEK
jgi:hypothetical protein